MRRLKIKKRIARFVRTTTKGKIKKKQGWETGREFEHS